MFDIPLLLDCTGNNISSVPAVQKINSLIREVYSESDIHQYSLLHAKETLALRELAKRSYRDFLKYWCVSTQQPLQWGWFHDYIADIMQSVTLRQRKRVIVNIPPRHLKSTLISQAWHAWMIGREDTPNSALMSIAATATLAGRDSRYTINMLRGDWYQSLFPSVQLTRENEMEWETKGGAYRIAAGREGTITGRGGSHITIDDLVLANEADSELIREKANEWLGSTLASRLNDPKRGTITVIQQRLHERDTTGYLLEKSKIDGADKYEHIVLPLEAKKRTIISLDGKVYKTREVDDLLQPERIGPDEVKAIKINMRINYDGQYQQNPIKQQGGMLDPTRLIRIDSTGPELIRRFGLIPNVYLDFATREKQTQKDDPDYSTMCLAAKDQLNRVFILHVFREQCDYEKLARTLVGLHKAYSPRSVKGEKGGLINTFFPILRLIQQQSGTFFPLMPFTGPSSNGDKVHRSTTFQGMLNAGMICVPQNAGWLPDMESEMRSFPNGAHDDIVDGLSMACNDVLDIRKGEAPMTTSSDERTLMDEDIKRRLLAKIAEQKAEREGQYATSDDW